jgi:transcriptional regulator with XRE-family HTH domain
MYEVGKQIRQLRESKGLTLRELGKLTHLSHSFIGDIESGRSSPSLNTLQSFSRVFGVSVPDLLQGELPSPKQTRLPMRLKELRNARGLSQEDLAISLNLIQQTVGNYETGRTEPNLNTLAKIADFFNVSVDYLIGRSDRKPKTARQLFADKMKLLKVTNPLMYQHYPEEKKPFYFQISFEMLDILAQHTGKPVSWFFEEGNE